MLRLNLSINEIQENPIKNLTSLKALLTTHCYAFNSFVAWFEYTLVLLIYTEQQKKRIFCIFGIVFKLGFKYRYNDMQGINDAWNMCIINCITNG